MMQKVLYVHGKEHIWQGKMSNNNNGSSSSSIDENKIAIEQNDIIDRLSVCVCVWFNRENFAQTQTSYGNIIGYI